MIKYEASKIRTDDHYIINSYCADRICYRCSGDVRDKYKCECHAQGVTDMFAFYSIRREIVEEVGITNICVVS